jgi:hypothetical protein
MRCVRKHKGPRLAGAFTLYGMEFAAGGAAGTARYEAVERLRSSGTKSLKQLRSGG